MSLAIVGPTTTFATTILSYFSPSKSPFYSVIAFGTVALVLSCDKIDRWLAVSIPVLVVLALSTVLSFNNRPTFDAGQGEEQLRFARSFSVSSALLAFIITAREVNDNPIAFWTNYAACLAQIATFMAYTWARSKSVEEQRDLNFVQFALITATFLIGASYGNSQFVTGSGDAKHANTTEHYALVTLSLYLLWLCCLLYWVRHLAKLIRVEIPNAPIG